MQAVAHVSLASSQEDGGTSTAHGDGSPEAEELIERMQQRQETLKASTVARHFIA